MRNYIRDPRMLVGCFIILVMAILAGIIAVGKVHQESSYGLPYLLGGFQSLSGAFAGWAFGRSQELPSKDKD